MGKFQNKLPKEKDAPGVANIVPRKRKLAPANPTQEREQSLNIIESVLNKRPKLNIERAVDNHMHKEQVQ